MRAPLLLSLVALACDKGPASQPRDVVTARGSLQFSPRPDAAVGIYFKSELDLLRGDAFLASVAKRFPEAKVPRGAVAAAHRPDTMIVDVSVSDADPHKAAATCNHIMQTFVELHLQRRLTRVHDEQARLTADLAANPSDEAKQRLAELLAHAMENDIKTLEPCVVPDLKGSAGSDR